MFSKQTQQQKALTTGFFLAVIWAIGAAVQPTSTYHLAPLLVAGMVPGVTGAARNAELFSATAIGAGLALGTGVLLSALNLLRGPTLLPYGGALAEAVTFAVIGAAGGAVIAILSLSRRSESAV